MISRRSFFGVKLIHVVSAALLLVAFCSGVADAALFGVDSNLDLPDANPGDGIALSQEGFATLRAAVEEANALPGTDAIRPGSHSRCLFAQLNGASLVVEDDLHIYYPGPCVADRGGPSLARILRAINGVLNSLRVRAGVTLTLENLGVEGLGDQRSAVYVEPGATLYLVGSTIDGNAEVGGAVYNDHGTVVLVNSVFETPVYDAEEQRMLYGFSTFISGSTTATGSAFHNDNGVVRASGSFGLVNNGTGIPRDGGILYNDGGTILLDGTPPFGFRTGFVVGGDSLGHGGGIYSRNGTVSLKNMYLAQHRAAGNGGAIYLDGGTLSMEGVYITGSAASGGAVYVASGTVQTDRVLVAEATASEAGGGMYLAGGTATLVNTTFSGNTAATTGGGLHVGDAASALLLNTTFSQNTAATGGGLWAGGPGKGEARVRLGNSLLAGNAAPAGLDVWGEVLSLGHNLVGVTEGSTGFGVPGDLTGTLAAPREPRLDSIPAMPPFPEAGDLLPVYALLEDSPARDAGNTALLMDTTLLAETPGYDQRGPGYPRFQGTAVDIGAYEYALPRVVPEHHSADQNANARINLSELLRVVQLYNLAAYHCDATGEDGYAPGPGDAPCPPHTSDYNPQDWRITLSELLRLIQLYNTPNYTPCPNGEDGYCLP
jgi:predicted outer membrane repeat protein